MKTHGEKVAARAASRSPVIPSARSWRAVAPSPRVGKKSASTRNPGEAGGFVVNKSPAEGGTKTPKPSHGIDDVLIPSEPRKGPASMLKSRPESARSGDAPKSPQKSSRKTNVSVGPIRVVISLPVSDSEYKLRGC